MNFGEELEIEILLRLALKSLMRFKCVQTSWNNLIKTPYFVNRVTKLSRNRSLLIIENSKVKLLPREGGDDNEKPILVNSLFPNNLARIESYGSCNGVFCLKGIYADTKSHGQLIMWNPTTNEVHHISRLPHHEKDFLYGFGAVDGDFKVVRLITYHCVWKKLLSSFVEVYSLNTKSWTIIHTNCPRIDFTDYHPSRYNALVNGVYYWIISSNLNTNPNYADILSFNFCNNEFGQLTSPILYVLRSSYLNDLIEIKGSLGYVLQLNSANNVGFEIWVMDQNKWSRMYAITTSTMLNLRRFGNDAAEIYGGNAGELLESYDHDGNKLHQFQIKIPEGSCAMHMSMCPTYDYFSIYEYVPTITLLSK
jgi:F-box interacting protein